MRVIHEPNSGWAGRPRNVGMDAATGEFVQFVDQDDALGPEALERLTGYGEKHSADIVLGKVTSDFRRVPHELYRRNVPRCSIRDAPLIRTLTPHKMFRRDFLVANGLRFPEGRRRLEDQLFVVQAYFATDAVAILADYPSYFFLQREDRGHSATLPYTAADYYGNLREVLDVIAASTEPGEFRDGLHQKFLNSMLHKASRMARPKRADQLDSFLTEIKAVIADYFSPEVLQRPPILRRQIAAAIAQDKPMKIRRLNRRYQELTAGIHSLSAKPSGVGKWTISASASMHFPDGSPVRFHREGDGWRIDERLQAANLDVRPDSTEELLAPSGADLLLRSNRDRVVWLGPALLPSSLEPNADGNGHRMVMSGTIELDVQTFAAGGPLAKGIWHLALRIRAGGTSRSASLVQGPGIEVTTTETPTQARPQLKFRDDGRLVLVV
jgi:hypothetical protein